MTTLWVRTLYFARTAWGGMRASPITSAIASITIGLALVLFGTFALLLQNMEGVLDRLGDDLFVTAYLEDGQSAEELRALQEIVRTVEGVSGVRIVSKAEALERFRGGVGRGGSLLEGLSENPLPASLEIELAPERRSAAGMAMVVVLLTLRVREVPKRCRRTWGQGPHRAPFPPEALRSRRRPRPWGSLRRRWLALR